MRRVRLLALLGSLALPTGCAVVHDDAAALLGRGRYVEALEQLAAEEPAARRYGRQERAHYALYRGLTHLALGDARATDRWLGEAKARMDAEPGCLSAEDRGRLFDAWISLGRGPLRVTQGDYCRGVCRLPVRSEPPAAPT